MNTDVVDPRVEPKTKQWHPWVLAIVFAEGDLALVAEVDHVSPEEITKFAIEHAEEITIAMYEAFKGKLLKEMQSRLGGLSDGNLLKLFELVKGNPGFSVEVSEATGASGGTPSFTINMGVQKKASDGLDG